MSLADEIRNEIENIKELKITVGDINSHLSVLEGLTRKDNEERDKESYQRGHDDGYEAGCATAFKPVSDAEYQRGLDEAMNAFKKLYSCGWERDWKAMGFEFDEGEWSTSFEFIIGHYTAAEIVEKVKTYEDKHSDRIEVGDEVIWKTENITLIVTSTYETSGFDWCDGVAQDGKVYHTLMENDRKTGKHYDIASILEAMRT